MRASPAGLFSDEDSSYIGESTDDHAAREAVSASETVSPFRISLKAVALNRMLSMIEIKNYLK